MAATMMKTVMTFAVPVPQACSRTEEATEVAVRSVLDRR